MATDRPDPAPLSVRVNPRRPDRPLIGRGGSSSTGRGSVSTGCWSPARRCASSASPNAAPTRSPRSNAASRSTRPGSSIGCSTAVRSTRRSTTPRAQLAVVSGPGAPRHGRHPAARRHGGGRRTGRDRRRLGAAARRRDTAPAGQPWARRGAPGGTFLRRHRTASRSSTPMSTCPTVGSNRCSTTSTTRRSASWHRGCWASEGRRSTSGARPPASAPARG